MSAMQISQLAKACGVPASTLRYYEAAGLLPADRTPAGYRTYGPDAVERLRFITTAKHLGLPLDEIADLLHVWESGTCAEVKATLQPNLTSRLAETESRRAELSAFADMLRATLAHLDALPDRATRCDPTCAPPASLTRTLPVASTTTPIACALTPEQATNRVTDWHNATAGATHHPIDNGLRLTLPADRAVALTTLAAAEQQCCPFFDFRLHLDGPDVHLEVRAPADATDLLTHLLAA